MIRRQVPLANISISLEGIDKAIENLNYRPDSVKQKAILAIRAFYTSEESLKNLNKIDTDTLIQSVWDVGDSPSKIKSKRRNFSSIKSSINGDLEKLSKKKQNLENITISDSNIFDMTEEAKNNLLSSFTDAVKTGDINIDQATNLLKTVTDFLENFQIENNETDSKDIVDQIKKILNKITEDVLSDEDLASTPGFKRLKKGAFDFSQNEEIDGTAEQDATIKGSELAEGQQLEKIDALDDDLEEVDADEDIEEIEIDDDLEVEDFDEIDEDIEDIELADDQELEEIDTLDDDLEEVDADEDIEEIEIDDDLEIEEVEDFEEIDEDIEDIELADDQELEELDEDELKALDDFRKKKELAEHFDETLGEREKKYNKYVTVPEGKYTVGTKKNLKSSLELQQFDMPKVHIGAYPVTNSLFEIFIEQTGYVTTAEKSGFGCVYHSRFKKNITGSTWNKAAGSENIPGACWYQPFGPKSTLHEKRNHPVVQVSVDDAIAFASWIGRRIPTEAEWEAAARTDLGYTYPWGDDFNPKAFNVEKSGVSDTSAVDKYDAFANDFKIVDMLGNVMEWTSDMETPTIKSRKNTRYCVAKGAAWNAKNDVSISSRALFKPGATSNIVGFRCISEIFL